MADEQEINFKIKPDGTIDVDLIGYTGTACEEELRKIATALGQAVKSKHKAEYYEEPKVNIYVE